MQGGNTGPFCQPVPHVYIYQTCGEQPLHDIIYKGIVCIFYLAGCCGSVAAALGSSFASSEGAGTAAGVGAGAEAGAEAGTAVDVEPESCTVGLGASEAGGEAVAAGLAFI